MALFNHLSDGFVFEPEVECFLPVRDIFGTDLPTDPTATNFELPASSWSGDESPAHRDCLDSSCAAPAGHRCSAVLSPAEIKDILCSDETSWQRPCTEDLVAEMGVAERWAHCWTPDEDSDAGSDNWNHSAGSNNFVETAPLEMNMNVEYAAAPRGESVESPSSKKGKVRCRRNKKALYWTPEDHAKFVMGLEQFGLTDGLGPGGAELMSVYMGNRTVLQIRSHFQKYVTDLANGKSGFPMRSPPATEPKS